MDEYLRHLKTTGDALPLSAVIAAARSDLAARDRNRRGGPEWRPVVYAFHRRDVAQARDVKDLIERMTRRALRARRRGDTFTKKSMIAIAESLVTHGRAEG